MARARVNEFVKNYKKYMRNERKNHLTGNFEFALCFASNTKTQRVFDAYEIRELFPRRRMEKGSHCGATKVTHTYAPRIPEFNLFDAEEMQFIVVKRYKTNGWMSETGNQLVNEIACWEKFAERSEADFLCPILRWGYQQGDKIDVLWGDEAVNTVYIVSVKAVFIGDLSDACKEAERRNYRDGFLGQNAWDREEEIGDFADSQGWRDVRFNGGNCGVIFDAVQNCWKAVIVDYAL